MLFVVQVNEIHSFVHEDVLHRVILENVPGKPGSPPPPHRYVHTYIHTDIHAYTSVPPPPPPPPSFIPGPSGQSLLIVNDVDIRPESNKELAMRFVTGVQNKDRIFHTDLNGFQVCK